MGTASGFSHRIAGNDDVPAIIELMRASIEVNMADFLSAEEIESAKECMGVDQTLIDDGTYFVIETVVGGETVMAGCGGWGKRRTLYGGDQTAGRDDSLSDPATEPARIRAMYTHPDWTRRGIGTLQIGCRGRHDWTPVFISPTRAACGPRVETTTHSITGFHVPRD